jgi:hypothetical protein
MKVVWQYMDVLATSKCPRTERERRQAHMHPNARQRFTEQILQMAAKPTWKSPSWPHKRAR